MRKRRWHEGSSEREAFPRGGGIAVRPPEYWPRLAYMALMDRAGDFVLADTFQYSRQSYQNRTRLRTPDGWMWISVPLKGRQHGLPSCRAEIERRDRHWMRAHWRAFVHNYRTTPFFPFYEHRLRPLFEREWVHLADLTCATVQLLHDLYGLDTRLTRATKLPGRPADLPSVLGTCGRREALVPAVSAPIDMQHAPSARVVHFEEPRYRQNFDGFCGDMTALDLLFNYGRDAIVKLREGIVVGEPGDAGD